MREYIPMRLPFKLLIAALLVLTAACAAAAGLVLFVSKPAPVVTTTGTADIGGPFTLVSTRGGTVTDQTYRGKWLVLFFGYTYCPDVCPTTLNNISVALEELGADANKLQPVFVTVDPDQDTREVLSDYLKSFDSRIVGLTGTQAQIDRIVKEYRIYVAKQKSESGDDDYLVVHSAYIYLMDPQGKFVNVIQGTQSGKEIAAWLRKETVHSKS